LVGLILAGAGLVLSSSNGSNASGKGGAVVIIGFIPIVFGSDARVTKQLLVLAIFLVIALIIFYLIRTL